MAALVMLWKNFTVVLVLYWTSSLLSHLFGTGLNQSACVSWHMYVEVRGQPLPCWKGCVLPVLLLLSFTAQHYLNWGITSIHWLAGVFYCQLIQEDQPTVGSTTPGRRLCCIRKVAEWEQERTNRQTASSTVSLSVLVSSAYPDTFQWQTDFLHW